MILALTALLSFALGSLLTALAAGAFGFPAAMLTSGVCGIVSVAGALAYAADLADQAQTVAADRRAVEDAAEALVGEQREEVRAA